MLAMIPFFNPSTYVTLPDSYDLGLQLLSYHSKLSPAFTKTFQVFVETQAINAETPLILVSADGAYWQSRSNPDDLRIIEKAIVTFVNTENDKAYVAIYDLTMHSRYQAGFGILLTLIVCAVLGFGSMILNKTTNDLVIDPIEAMISKVKRISENPLKAAQEDENTQWALEEFELSKKKSLTKHKSDQPLETTILE